MVDGRCDESNVQDSSASSQIDSVRFLQRLISVLSGRFFASLAFSLHRAQFLCEDLLASLFSAGCDLGFAKISILLESQFVWRSIFCVSAFN